MIERLKESLIVTGRVGIFMLPLPSVALTVALYDHHF